MGAGASNREPSSTHPSSPSSHTQPTTTKNPTPLRKQKTEINALRAARAQLSAQLSVAQSLVSHLNGAMKSAVERADDGDAAVGDLAARLAEARRQLEGMSRDQVGVAGWFYLMGVGCFGWVGAGVGVVGCGCECARR